MPVAGVARNPLGETSDRFHRLPVLLAARRQDVIHAPSAAPGTIRRLWRNLAGYTGAGPSFNQTKNAFAGDAPLLSAVTTPLRYLISTVDTLTAGNQLSQPIVRPAIVRQRQAPAPPLVYVGNLQQRPTVRTRVPSFGSRIAPINGAYPGGDQ